MFLYTVSIILFMVVMMRGSITGLGPIIDLSLIIVVVTLSFFSIVGIVKKVNKYYRFGSIGMNNFHTALDEVNQLIYKPNGFTIKNIQEEKQNSKYGAGIFQLLSRTIRFRVANITPTKSGQFVAIWEKDEHNKNQAFKYEKAPDLLVITISKIDDYKFGQFVFPKDILLKHKILSTASQKGKMALRVYAPWDKPTNSQAIKTRKWQLPYFIDMTHPDLIDQEKVKGLYSL